MSYLGFAAATWAVTAINRTRVPTEVPGGSGGDADLAIGVHRETNSDSSSLACRCCRPRTVGLGAAVTGDWAGNDLRRGAGCRCRSRRLVIAVGWSRSRDYAAAGRQRRLDDGLAASWVR